MKVLASMGFLDTKKNAEVLARTNGNINFAISMLLQNNTNNNNNLFPGFF